MLQITEDTQQRLVLHDSRLMLRLLAAAFTLISVFSVLTMVVQGYRGMFVDTQVGLQEPSRLVAWLMFIVVGLGFIAFGLFALINLSHSVHVELDRNDETVSIRSVNGLRPVTVTHSIYGVSHVAVESDPNLRVFALYLVLRSGERIVLTTLPAHEENQVERIRNAVRSFLRQ